MCNIFSTFYHFNALTVLNYLNRLFEPIELLAIINYVLEDLSAKRI